MVAAHTVLVPQSNQLWELDNILIVQQYCGSVGDWHERFATYFIDNLERWLAGEKLHNLL